MPPRRLKKLLEITTAKHVGIRHNISIGLIGIALGLISLTVGIALLTLFPTAALLVNSRILQAGTPTTSNSISLSWTAPGDNGMVGQAASYDIRVSTSALSDTSFSSAARVPDIPTPAVAGTHQELTVTGLQAATTYYFGLKTSDAAGNVSSLSNIASATTAAAVASCIPVYRCGDWSACLGQTQTRTCDITNSCSVDLDPPLSVQQCTGSASPELRTHVIVVGGAPGSTAAVRVIDPVSRKVLKQFYPFGVKARSGMRLAVGNLAGDRLPLIAVGAEGASDPVVKIFSTSGKQIMSFRPYPVSQKGGVEVAMADIDGNGRDELITVPDSGPAQVRVWSYNASKHLFGKMTELFVFPRTVTNGFSLAAGDMGLDGKAEIAITARKGAKTVSILKMVGQRLEVVKKITPFSITFSSGMSLAMGDILGTGQQDVIVTGGPKYWSSVKVFDIQGHLQASFLPTVTSYLGGVGLSALDVNRDGRDEILTGSYGSGDAALRIFRYDGTKNNFDRIDKYLVFPTGMSKGLRLAAD